VLVCACGDQHPTHASIHLSPLPSSCLIPIAPTIVTRTIEPWRTSAPRERAPPRTEIAVDQKDNYGKDMRCLRCDLMPVANATVPQHCRLLEICHHNRACGLTTLHLSRWSLVGLQL